MASVETIDDPEATAEAEVVAIVESNARRQGMTEDRERHQVARVRHALEVLREHGMGAGVLAAALRIETVSTPWGRLVSVREWGRLLREFEDAFRRSRQPAGKTGGKAMASRIVAECDLCGERIESDRHLLRVESGSLRGRRPEIDLCPSCFTGFLERMDFELSTVEARKTNP